MESKFVINGEETTSKGQIAHGYNKYFIDVGKCLGDLTSNRDTDPSSFVKYTNTASMFYNCYTRRNS